MKKRPEAEIPKPDPELVRAWAKCLLGIDREADKTAYRALFVHRKKRTHIK